MSKIFLDTNIILDIIDAQRPNNKKIHLLLEHLILNDIDIVISEDMLSTIFYIQEDKQLVLKFLHSIQKRWIISSFGKSVIKKAIELSMEKNLDLEDTLQCLCAKENGCEALITNDIKFYNCGVSIYTIEDFLKL
ncbi:type II toxin-antitoxin system VapC family toxin [Methyloprofundus sp.]|uniref:type II toxin-antitoxin system VapC family toxin n=1 Tax=Methyloprofundus sp. TaxID=2020875 RepID=UPI003D13A79B